MIDNEKIVQGWLKATAEALRLAVGMLNKRRWVAEHVEGKFRIRGPGNVLGFMVLIDSGGYQNPYVKLRVWVTDQLGCGELNIPIFRCFEKEEEANKYIERANETGFY